MKSCSSWIDQSARHIREKCNMAVLQSWLRRSLALATGAVMTLTTGAALGGSVTYTYDNLGRMKTATYSNGVFITYNYDALGNRTSVVVSGA
jgi:YD repeat-containing protein